MQTLENENRTQVQLPAGQSLLIAEMLRKSGQLFEGGYWAQMLDTDLVTIMAPPSRPGRSDAHRYTINLRANTCECDAFRGGRYRIQDGRRTCKHLNGVFLLAACCADSLMAFYNEVAAEFNAVASHYDRRQIHMGHTLEQTFGKSAWANTADNSRKLAGALNEMLTKYRPADGRRAEGRREAA